MGSAAVCAASVTISPMVELLQAQHPLVVAGIVTDSSGNSISGASVSVVGTETRIITDVNGEFRLPAAVGPIEIRARRLGFAPVNLSLDSRSGEQLNHVHLRMATLPITLNRMIIAATHAEYAGRLAGYYERLQKRTGGYFISRNEIDQKNFKALSQLLRNVPGINAFPLRSGGGAVRMRGRACAPIVWLDGVAMPAGEVDLDAFPVSTLHGIEVYSGTAAVPANYVVNGGYSGCGTILLWSRGADTDPPVRRGKPVDLQALVESFGVFSADQVERPADPVGSLVIPYPPELFANGVDGFVLVEFVVDAEGAIEPDTYSIVSSTHPLFSAAVGRALKNLTFVPATRDGKTVRQAVQQPFRFTTGPRKTAQGRI